MTLKDEIKTLKKYTILYVEDNKEIAEELVFFFEPFLHKLYYAKDGREGLELFEEHKPDVIITDIQMPHMNGIQMIEKIRETGSDIPIVITTVFNENDY